MVEWTRPDILIVGIVVVIAVIALIVVFVKWFREKMLYGNKQRELIRAAHEVEHSQIID